MPVTIAVDLDGTINSYLQRRTWTEQTVFDDQYDFPLPGAVEWMTTLVAHFRVVVFTCRASAPGGKEAVEAWLTRWGFPAVEVTSEKPVAWLYIDDNAFRFSGQYPSPDVIAAQQSWILQERTRFSTMRRTHGTNVD